MRVSKARRQVLGGGSGRQVAVYGHAVSQGEVYSARFEFYGSGRELYQAVKFAYEGYVPRHAHTFVKVSARDFLRNPELYGVRGYWTAKDVRS